MKKKENKLGRKIIALLAGFSVVVAIIEGIYYYSAEYDNLFFRILLIMENCIKAFAFNASISLDDMLENIQENPNFVKTAVGYLYGIALFAAPYCTAAVAYSFLERALRLVFRWHRSKDEEHVIVFGSNPATDAMLDEETEAEEKAGETGRKRRIHVVSSEEVDAEKRYKLLKKGYFVHEFDGKKVQEDEVEDAAKRLEFDRADKVLLMEESTLDNFALLQLTNAMASSVQRGVKVYCRAEEQEIRKMIADWYDSRDTQYIDLEFMDLPQIQIRDIFSRYPLDRGVHASGNAPVHLLVAGFGRVGQQAVLQAMNLGVTGPDNLVLADIVDFEMEEKAELFSGHFAPGVFVETDGEEDKTLRLAPELADGELTLRFHSCDFRGNAFEKLLERINGDPCPLTTCVIAVGDEQAAMRCVEVLRRIGAENGGAENEGVEMPVLLRMDENRRIAEYIAKNSDIYSSVHLMRDIGGVFSFDTIFRDDTDKDAKEFNAYYALAQFTRDLPEEERDPEDAAEWKDPVEFADEAWKKLTLFRRDSSRASAYHENVKRRVRPELYASGGAELARLFGRNGSVMSFDRGSWDYSGTEEEFAKRLSADPEAGALARTEHRRWCYFMISEGWRYEPGKKNDLLKTNPCITTWDKLVETRDYMCKYDLMPYLEAYQELCGGKA